MKRILLAAVNAKYIHSNLAVFSLRAYAQERGIPVELAEYTINQSKDEIMKGIFQSKPDVLCFSCYIWNISFVRELITDLHKVLPATEIWVGGPEVSYDAVKVLEENPGISGVMRGEGEKTFAELAAWFMLRNGDGSGREVENHPEINEILGITYRNQQGLIQINPDRGIMDLSEVPFPYEDLQDFDHRIIYYESSRGCPFSCSYCLSSIDKRLRFRNLELVKKELQFLIDHKVPQVKFVDRTFNCKKEHAMEIWQYLLDSDYGVTNFHFEIAADLITEEELALLAKMRPGLVQLEIGVQSTNLKTLEAIKRKMDFDKVGEIVQKIQESHNIHQHLDLIAGLPYEDYESFSKSFQDVYSLHPQQLQLGFLKVLKGSYMEEHLEEYKGIYQNKEPYEILATRWLPYEDVLRLKQVEEMVEVYYNSGQFQNLMKAMEEKYANMFQFFACLGEVYEERGYLKLSHTRIRRYEILLDFLKERFPEEIQKFRELAVLDVYARENAKSRPSFADDLGNYKEQRKKFFQQEEGTRELLPSYKEYDWKQMMKMTHVEILSSVSKERKAVLFDYKVRDPLTGSARQIDVTERMHWY